MSGRDQRWVVAIDGGGTKIDLAALELSKKCVPLETSHRWSFPGTGSAHPSGWPIAGENLAKALRNVIASIDSVPQTIVLALAGAGRREDRQRVVEFLRSQPDFASNCAITCVGDIDPLVDFGDEKVRCIAVILGTGSIVAARSANGELVRAGGWGPNLGDEGSGATLGNLALRSAAAWIDSGAERNQAGPLVHRVIETLSANVSPDNADSLDRDAIAKFLIDLAADRTATARLARLVVELALAEDPESLQLVQNQLDRLAVQVEQVWRRAGNPGSYFQLIFSGGVARNELIRSLLVTNCRNRGLPIIGSIIADPLLAVLKFALRIGDH